MDFVEYTQFLKESEENIPKKKYSEMTLADVKLRKLTNKDIMDSFKEIKGALDRLKDM